MRSQQSANGEAGFTLLEMLVAASIMVAVMTLVLTALDMNANVTRVQTDVADVQQSMRVGQREMHRLVRMTARGGLPRPQSVVATQDVADGTTIGSENVMAGTDVVTLRGAFNTPIFRLDAADPASFQVGGNTATFVIDSVTRSAFDQPLDALHDLVEEGAALPEPILIVGRQGEAVYAVTELSAIEFQNITLDIQNLSTEVERATLTVNIASGSGTHIDAYLGLSSGGSCTDGICTGGGFPANLTSGLFATVLEEYRYYVREDFSIPGDDSSPPSPKLSRARMVPNTNLVHPGSAENAAIDIADNIFDLQVALGIDLDGNGKVDTEDEDGTPLALDADEWLFNHESDDGSLASWLTAPLQHVRLTILGQTQTADRTYVSEALDTIEDRSYGEGVPSTPDEIEARRYRRRLLQSTIDLRNL
jgi:type II secretory pathway pseudopilin PulG